MLLKIFHAIPKRMFTPDISTIRNIMRAMKENSVIVIFPEGRLSAYGHTLPVAEGTAELIKKLGVDVYHWQAPGAYLTFPKWRDKGDDRIGKINLTVKQLLTAEQVAEKSVAEIKLITDNAICHDDELAMAGVEYKCKDISKGVDRILYKCPVCMQEGNITAGGGHIRCSCGLDAELDSTYRLHGAPFDRINEWFDWQQASIDISTESLYSKVRLGCINKDGCMDSNAGEGEIYIDKDILNTKYPIANTLKGGIIDTSRSIYLYNYVWETMKMPYFINISTTSTISFSIINCDEMSYFINTNDANIQIPDILHISIPMLLNNSKYRIIVTLPSYNSWIGGKTHNRSIESVMLSMNTSIYNGEDWDNSTQFYYNLSSHIYDTQKDPNIYLIGGKKYTQTDKSIYSKTKIPFGKYFDICPSIMCVADYDSSKIKSFTFSTKTTNWYNSGGLHLINSTTKIYLLDYYILRSAQPIYSIFNTLYSNGLAEFSINRYS
jgi:hypothetical protein